MNYLLCQINSRVGDLAYNYQKIMQAYRNNLHSDIIIFPELALTGYPLGDLANNPEFIRKTHEYIALIVAETKDTAILFGSLYHHENLTYNTAIFAYRGIIARIIFKKHLPNYGVFNEARNFTSGDLHIIVPYKGENIGILICEDMWFDDVAYHYAQQDASIFIAINASPYDTRKQEQRYEKARHLVKTYDICLIYVNLLGGQDELVFDGGSFVLGKSKADYAVKPHFWSEAFIEYNNDQATEKKPYCYSKTEHIYQALMLALRDYMQKNNFNSALVGLSGGLDSAIVALIAADAMGPDNVHAIMLPGPFTTQASIEDAASLAMRIGCCFDSIDTHIINNVFLDSLGVLFKDKDRDVTEENLQARIRGSVLMAVSNKLKSMLISTSNKSEFAVGYSTLYGDMCGSFALIYDLYKTEIYDIIQWRNKNIPMGSLLQKIEIIPQAIIEKAPSAELNVDQKDSDALPEYSILDPILRGLVEHEISAEELSVVLNIDVELVRNIEIKIVKNEFKRRQSAIGPKISTKCFNVERKYPITTKFKI